MCVLGATSRRLCLGSRLSQGQVQLCVLGWHCAALREYIGSGGCLSGPVQPLLQLAGRILALLGILSLLLLKVQSWYDFSVISYTRD